jgi:hypothetical protein
MTGANLPGGANILLTAENNALGEVTVGTEVPDKYEI